MKVDEIFDLETKTPVMELKHMIKVFIGYDSKEKVAFNVLSYSILKNSTRPVSITPIYLPNIKDNFTRERSNLESTEFSFSRFIVLILQTIKWAVLWIATN